MDQLDLERCSTLPKTISIKGRDGDVHDDVPMWHYMALQEGTLGVDPEYQKTNDGAMPPVIHVDTDAPLYSDRDGALITDKLWGLYYKPDFHFGGVQGGAMPATVERPAGRGARRSLRTEVAGVRRHRQLRRHVDLGARVLPEALRGPAATCTGRSLRAASAASRPTAFPVFDRFRENVYVIADSNHGYKMIGVGELVADELLGERRALLEPFRFSRYAEGRLHPVSNSPFPWS